MVTKGGGNGTPSYKQVVVDRGKGPRGISFKEPLTGTSGSGSEKNQEGNQEKSDRVGEEAREAQKGAQEMANPSGVDGRNPCKPKTTLIPKVILEDPQTQLFLGSDEDACTDLQVHGPVAHRKNIAQLDKIPLEAKWRS
jgi:hypothetical protein